MVLGAEAALDRREELRAEWLAVINRHRSARTAPDSDRYWFRRLDTASADNLRAVQNEKLRVAVRYVYETIPFYRRKFDRIGITPAGIRSVDDLRHVPVTTKQEMADDLAERPPWGSYTAVDEHVWRRRGWQTFATSGTTAQPRVFRYTRFDREMWAWGNARGMWAMGFRPGRDVALLAFGYGPHVWLWGVHHALNLMGIPVLTAGGLDSAIRARMIDAYRPTVLACTPSYALYLASVMRDLGLDAAASSVRYLFCAGEPGFSVPATRRRLEDTWQAELHEFYGCTEASPAGGGYTCTAVVAEKDGPVSTHLMDDLQYWEVVHPKTLEPVPDGERGLSVVTNLASEASPQIRFLVGDFTVLTRVPCACGRGHSRAVGGFLGRDDDMLNVRGISVFPSSVEDAVRRVAGVGEEFVIVVTTERDLDVLTLRVEARPGADPRGFSALAAQVEREVRLCCELRPVVDVVPHGTLPRTEFKAKRVQDLRRAADGAGSIHEPGGPPRAKAPAT